MEVEKPMVEMWHENRRNERRKTVHLNVSIYKGDAELIDWLVEFLGTSRSDAIRTAVRAYATLMQAQRRDMRRKENKT